MPNSTYLPKGRGKHFKSVVVCHTRGKAVYSWYLIWNLLGQMIFDHCSCFLIEITWNCSALTTEAPSQIIFMLLLLKQVHPWYPTCLYHLDPAASEEGTDGDLYKEKASICFSGLDVEVEGPWDQTLYMDRSSLPYLHVRGREERRAETPKWCNLWSKVTDRDQSQNEEKPPGLLACSSAKLYWTLKEDQSLLSEMCHWLVLRHVDTDKTGRRN